MSPPRYPAGTWRLLISRSADGATNMAIDEAILRAVSAGLVSPTLRLYAWEPPCLSLGRGQPGAEADRAACARDGVPVVRRPTGGRAILHTDELTYSVIAPLDEPRVAGDILTSYHHLSRALVAALQHLSVNVESHLATAEGPGTEAPNPVCFEVPSHYELTTADGRKLVGSAQMRTSDVVLQHGTLPLEGDIARICCYLTGAPQPERVRARAATLASTLGRRVDWGEAAEALAVGFSTALNLTLNRGELTPEEQSWVAELRDSKYANEVWTWRL
jgi:lipoate-protein ligase A